MTVESTAARKPRRSSGTKRVAGAASAAKPAAAATAQTQDAVPQLVQLLTPEGERTDNADNAEFAPFVADITTEDLRGLYRDMVMTRRFDGEATALQRQGSWACGPRSSARRPRRSAPAGP